MSSAVQKLMRRFHDATFIIKRAFISLPETSSCFTISRKLQPGRWGREHPGRKNKNQWQLNKFTFASVCVCGDNGPPLLTLKQDKELKRSPLRGDSGLAG